MTEPQWKTWKSEYDGHAPDDWSEGMECEFRNSSWKSYAWRPTDSFPMWFDCVQYRYRPCKTQHTNPTYWPNALLYHKQTVTRLLRRCKSREGTGRMM